MPILTTATEITILTKQINSLHNQLTAKDFQIDSLENQLNLAVTNSLKYRLETERLQALIRDL